MRVLKGWSEEIQSCKWAKSDVELDETDLHRLLAEGNVEEKYWNDLTTSQVFGILSLEAERLAYREYLTSIKRLGVEINDDMTKRLIVLSRRVKSLVTEVNPENGGQ
jgi:hypothetical protein